MPCFHYVNRHSLIKMILLCTICIESFILPVATIIPGAELLVEIVPDKYGFSDICSCRWSEQKGCRAKSINTLIWREQKKVDSYVKILHIYVKTLLTFSSSLKLFHDNSHLSVCGIIYNTYDTYLSYSHREIHSFTVILSFPNWQSQKKNRRTKTKPSKTKAWFISLPERNNCAFISFANCF